MLFSFQYHCGHRVQEKLKDRAQIKQLRTFNTKIIILTVANDDFARLIMLYNEVNQI